ncbi:TPA: GNAT family N-acetyltransferase [Klebsiella aerogenes]|nr:GNAT family N-acetyltransferase [Klebsiella aerogenes]ELY3085422.1 GNAT family N-acetyltransferase [Klebsiella aerogenes]HDS6594914.1 GNAT family N-acetyltransferase [Klebsiella aerogenes]HDU6301469.1 GNAT family N-acetyltransferase [Klebsiella aerogenes]
MPELLTPRLRCSPLQLDDWSFFLSLQQDPQVMLYVADNRPIADIRAAFDARLPVWSPKAAHWLCLVVRDRQSHTPLGLTGYCHHDDDIAEVGFLFAPQAQGQGYGYESLRALCDYAFSTGGIRRLTASVTAGNQASKLLLQKTGFIQEGELRASYWLHGRWHNDWLFGLMRHDYQ